MQMINVYSDVERAAYDRIKSLLAAENPTLNVESDFIVNQHTLRVEQVLSASQNSYTFTLRDTGNSRPLERRLNTNDLFFLTHIGLMLCKQDTSTTPPQYGNFPLFTNPDPNYFDGDNSGGTPAEFDALNCVYNGELTLATTPVERLKDFSTTILRYVPERGYLEPTTDQDDVEYPQFGPNLDYRGFFRLTPNIILDGDENNTVVVDLGAGDTTQIVGAVDRAGQSVNTRNVLVLMLHGFNVINGAQKLGRWTAF